MGGGRCLLLAPQLKLVPVLAVLVAATVAVILRLFLLMMVVEAEVQSILGVRVGQEL